MVGHKAHVSDEKKKITAELSKLAKEHSTILLASIKDIPASQYQEISKKLRGKAIVKVPKKSLTFRALDSLGNEAVEKLKEKIKNSTAILFSNLDAFDLSADLLNSRSPAKAKPGQEAPEDIEVQAGPTDLVPGPAISELGALGIQIQIDKGKINIKEPKVIAKQGEKISQGAADLMSKLGIMPFTVGFIPVAAFDSKTGKVYLDINIDQEGTVNDLKSAFGKSLAFAVEIGYSSQDTISFLIGKAGVQGKALEKFVASASAGEKTEEPIEEKKEEAPVEQKEQAEEAKQEGKSQEINQTETKTQEE
ncbi:MAG: 50S ribosomal protein L10 [Thermoplasmata archaeon M8B2D]|nr:MAG: 50S ribosomal protein L10 [Thermoplasmata archaeon M8B2D]